MVKTALPSAGLLGKGMTPLTGVSSSPPRVTETRCAGMCPLAVTALYSGLMIAVNETVRTAERGFSRTVALGAKAAAKSKTATMPKVKNASRLGVVSGFGSVASAAARSLASERRLLRLLMRTLRQRHPRRNASARSAKTGICASAATARVGRWFVITAICKPKASAARRKRTKSSRVRRLHPPSGQISRARGAFAHASLSSSEIRSSVGSTVIRAVFI